MASQTLSILTRMMSQYIQTHTFFRIWLDSNCRKPPRGPSQVHFGTGVHICVSRTGLDHSRGCCSVAAHPSPSFSSPTTLGISGSWISQLGNQTGCGFFDVGRSLEPAVEHRSLFHIGVCWTQQHWVSVFGGYILSHPINVVLGIKPEASRILGRSSNN